MSEVYVPAPEQKRISKAEVFAFILAISVLPDFIALVLWLLFGG